MGPEEGGFEIRVVEHLGHEVECVSHSFTSG
jgi:hypothetical protein